MGYVTKEEYKKQINEIVMLLEGKTEKIVNQIKIEIEEASRILDFEKAAYLRDKLIAIQRISEKQKVSNINENDIDMVLRRVIQDTDGISQILSFNSLYASGTRAYTLNVRVQLQSGVVSTFDILADMANEQIIVGRA